MYVNIMLRLVFSRCLGLRRTKKKSRNETNLRKPVLVSYRILEIHYSGHTFRTYSQEARAIRPHWIGGRVPQFRGTDKIISIYTAHLPRSVEIFISKDIKYGDFCCWKNRFPIAQVDHKKFLL